MVFWIIVLVLIVAVIWSSVDDKIKAHRKSEADKRQYQEQKRAQEDWRNVGVYNSYVERGMMHVREGRECPVCGHINEYTRLCDDCIKRCRKDMEDGVIPEGLYPGGTFDAEDWYVLRLIEYELKSGAISRQEALEKRAAAIREMYEREEKIKNPPPKKEMDTSYRKDYL